MRVAGLAPSLVLFATLLGAAPAGAVGRVLSGDGAARVAGLRVAVAATPDRRVLWSAFQIDGSAGPVGVVLPVAPGSLVDPAGDAWLAALDSATAPRIVPPGAPPDACATSARVDNTTLPEPPTRLQPEEVAVFDSTDAIAKWAASHALSFGLADSVALAASGERFIGVLYDLPGGGGTTSAIRIVGPDASGELPLFVSAHSGSSVRVVLFAIASAGVTAKPGQELGTDAVDPLWIWHDGTSDYRDRSASLLAQAAPATWLAEARGSAPLWSYRVLPGQAGAITPAVDAYFKRVAPADATSCIAAAEAANKLAWPVAAACPAGALLRVPDATGADPLCSEAPAPGETDPATLRCDGAEDLALALGGQDPGTVEVTRLRGLLRSDDAAVSLVSPAGDASPAVTAKRVDLHGCGTTSGTGGAPGSSSGGSGGGGTGAPQGGDWGYGNGGGTVYQDPGTNVDVNVNTSCSGDSSGSSSACSGDSSSSSSGDGSTCSGNSSSSSGDGSTCSGDSSSSSSDGSTCSGDSSSSSSDGSTCSGDSSSSSGDGSTCSGSSSSGSSDSCSGSSGSSSSCTLSRGRRRPRASALMVFLVGVAFPIRRAARGRRRRR